MRWTVPFLRLLRLLRLLMSLKSARSEMPGSNVAHPGKKKTGAPCTNKQVQEQPLNNRSPSQSGLQMAAMAKPPLGFPKMEPSPAYSSSRHVYIDMDPNIRRGELRKLAEIKCINKNNYGVRKKYIQAAFKELLGRESNHYGVKHGVMREVTDIFVLWKETGGHEVHTKVRVAFAVVCREGQMFHRLRSELVEQSVFLALLCGESATLLMDEILRVYADKWVTLDALPHAIGYYLRPAFGAGLMIDTRSSFDSSAEFRATYREFDTETREKRDAATSKITAVMEMQIPLGEMFVPRVESSSRRKGSVLDKTYGVAHIVYPPTKFPTETRAFEQMCYATVTETAHKEFLDREYWAPPDEGRDARSKRQRRDTATDRREARTKKARPMAPVATRGSV